MRTWLLALLFSVTAGRSLADPGTRPVRLPPARALTAAPISRVVLATAEIPVEASRPDEPVRVEGRAAESPTGALPLTFDSAIAIALRQNPALVALRQNEPVSRAALRVAGTYPYNPSAQAQVMPNVRFSDGGRGSTSTDVQILQTFEVAHQPRWRRQVGVAQLGRTQWEIVTAELQSMGETTRRYFAVLYRRRVYALNAQLADLNDQLLGILQRRYDAGQATAADVALAAMEARAARQKAELASASLLEARLSLLQYLGLGTEQSWAVVGDLEQWSWRPALDALTGGARDKKSAAAEPEDHAPRKIEELPSPLPPKNPIDPPEELAVAEQVPPDWLVEVLAADRPDVRAAEADLQAAVAACKLARASQVPNIDIGPAYAHGEDLTEFWGLSTQLTIPAFGIKRAVARQRSVEVRQKQVALQQRRRQAMLEIEVAWNQYERWRRVAEQLRGTSADQLLGQVRIVEDLFQAGQADLLRVYAARSQAVQVRLGFFQALDALGRATGNLIEAGAIAPDMLMTSTVRTQP